MTEITNNDHYGNRVQLDCSRSDVFVYKSQVDLKLTLRLLLILLLNY